MSTRRHALLGVLAATIVIVAIGASMLPDDAGRSGLAPTKPATEHGIAVGSLEALPLAREDMVTPTGWLAADAPEGVSDTLAFRRGDATALVRGFLYDGEGPVTERDRAALLEELSSVVSSAGEPSGDLDRATFADITEGERGPNYTVVLDRTPLAGTAQSAELHIELDEDAGTMLVILYEFPTREEFALVDPMVELELNAAEAVFAS